MGTRVPGYPHLKLMGTQVSLPGPGYIITIQNPSYCIFLFIEAKKNSTVKNNLENQRLEKEVSELNEKYRHLLFY